MRSCMTSWSYLSQSLREKAGDCLIRFLSFSILRRESSRVWLAMFLIAFTAISAESVLWQIMAMSFPASMDSWTSGPLP